MTSERPEQAHLTAVGRWVAGLDGVRRARAQLGGTRLGRRIRRRLQGDSGMNTAEYAVGTLAAVAFAGLLFKVVTSDAVQQGLSSLFTKALA